MLILAPAASGCTSAEGRSIDRPTLAVAAASDLQAAFGELGAMFEAETGTKVVFQFGSSGVLSKQIAQGAPVDLFASASEEYVDQLVGKGAALADTKQLYALGRIVLVTFKGSNPKVTRLADLLQDEVRHVAIANPEHAPYGRAAREALKRARLWDGVAAKIVYGENVQQALQFVQTGNAEAGIVARSLAGIPEVEVVPIDESLYVPPRQALVVVKGARQEGRAREFAAYVTGQAGRSILERHGFALPDRS